MSYLQPFFLLMGRASVFWVGAAVSVGLGIFLLGISQPDAITIPYLEPTFLFVFGFAGIAGWLGGAIIQESFHCSFAWALPSVLKRVAAGYLATGLAISLILAALASAGSTSSLAFASLLAIGLAAYGLCASSFESQSLWSGGLDLLIIATVVVRSRALADLAIAWPLPMIATSLVLALFGLLRLFTRSGLRRRALRIAKPFPGNYSLERSMSYGRQKLVRSGPTSSAWSPGYLGTRIWNWVRATIHSYGPLGWKTIPRTLSRLWVLAALMSIYAWSDKGEVAFGESLGKTIYGALFSSPYVPVFGQQSDRHPIVILVIAAMGATLALWSPAELKTSLAYPLSRKRLALVTYRVELLGVVVLLLGVFTVLSVTGHLAGWLVGYPLRIDFMPFFLHPLMATAALMPLVFWGRLHLHLASRRKAPSGQVAVIFGVVGFVALVWIWTAVAGRVFSRPLTEISVSAGLTLLSQSIYRRKLRNYFTTADLI